MVLRRLLGGMEGRSDKFATAREHMVQNDLIGRGIKDNRVIEAMRSIPREEFVPAEYRDQAYRDGPLPIGQNQTISQPYIVALMTQELKVNPDCEVLEIGTGSGYQTAILSRLAKKVYTIERFEPLSLQAQAVLKKLGITNVEFFSRRRKLRLAGGKNFRQDYGNGGGAEYTGASVEAIGRRRDYCGAD